MSIRPVDRVITAHRQREGGGFIVRRPFPTHGLQMVDPFLMLDEMGPVEYAPGRAIGAPDHPHRGFETVTYILDGELEHEDSAGHRGTLGPGSVQWMTAGSGIVHSEQPSAAFQASGGPMHGFQIWVNLPARLKMTEPRYQELTADSLPCARSEDGLAWVRVVAGHALDASAAIDTHTPIVFQHWRLHPGASVDQPVPADHNVFVYVFGGSVQLGEEATTVSDGQLAFLGAGEGVRLAADEEAELLLLGGVPIGEPVARYGPFVMNTETQIRQAIRDYQTGRMGRIAR